MRQTARGHCARGGGPGFAPAAETRDTPRGKEGPAPCLFAALLLLQLSQQMLRTGRERRRLFGVQRRSGCRALFRRHPPDGGPAMCELDGDLGAGARTDMPGR
jgi:hypothetical protein